MSSTVETSIWLALRSRVESLDIGVDVKMYPGELPQTPPSSGGVLQPYLRVGRVSADPVSPLIAYGKPSVRTGSLVVTLVHPLSASYTVSRYDQLAGLIARHFVDGTQMRHGDICVTVTDYPSVQEGYEDNGYWTVPVIIPWRTFA